ncbi:MAG: cytochrome P450 [Aquiluna sp.]|jgi:cytochrome P450|tara:strand:+ start:839 stop:2026 length:1188 start_codon:yes stop_codon:yes gene_type:complete
MIDFNDSAFIDDPYPALKKLREVGAPFWHEETSMFLAAGFKDASAVLRNRTLGRIFDPKTPESKWESFNWLHSDSILDSEPPKHTRLRSLVMKAFNPKKIEGLRPEIERITASLLDEAAKKHEAQGHFDLIADFAEPLPVKVIAHLLGFPEKDEHLLRPWSQAIVKMYEVSPSIADQEAAQLASDDFAAYVHELMLQRQTNPGTDLVSELAAVREEGEKLNTHELIATCVLLLNAGHEASVNGFGNGMVAALENKTQMAKLNADPDGLALTAVDEFLRFDAPLHLFERTATEDTVIGGVTIKKGQKIASLLGSANRDSAMFENPDELDLSRHPNPHIGFGAGIHFCIGAPLARVEMSVSLPALIKRFGNLELAEKPLRRQSFVLRGYDKVLVRNS